MKKYLLLIVIVGVAGALYYGIQTTTSHILDKSSTANTNLTRCSHTGQNHLVIMHGHSAVPNHVNAKLCDTLTIKNADPQIRLLAFGPHDHHTAYNGVLERTLQQNQSLTVTLNKTGTYQFHDHLDDAARGTFTVTQ